MCVEVLDGIFCFASDILFPGVVKIQPFIEIAL